jgi:hypothetical protein
VLATGILREAKVDVGKLWIGLLAGAASARVRYDAVVQSRLHGGRTNAVVEALKRSMQDRDALVRLQAALGYYQRTSKARPAVAMARRELASPSPRVRAEAVRVVGQLGEAGAVLLPQVRRLVSDPSPMVRYAVRLVL